MKSWPGGRSIVTAVALVAAANFALLAIMAPYLVDKGLGVGQVSAIFMATAVASAGSQYIWARAINRNAKGATWAALTIAALGTAGFAIGGHVAVLIVAAFALSCGFAGASTGFRTVVALSGTDEEQEYRFTRVSSAQTLGMLIGPSLLGLAVFNGTAIAPWFAFAMVALAAVVWGFSAQKARVVDETEFDTGGDETRFVARQWKVLLVLTLAPVMVLASQSVLYGAHEVIWGLYLREIGTPDPAVAWSFATFSVAFAVAAPLLPKVLGNLPRVPVAAFGATGLAILSIVTSQITNWPLAIGLTLVEGVLMAATLPILFGTIKAVVGSEHVTGAFALLGAIASLGSVVATGATGIIIGQIGIRPTLFAFGIYGAVVGIIAIFVAINQSKKSTRKLEPDSRPQKQSERTNP